MKNDQYLGKKDYGHNFLSEYAKSKVKQEGEDHFEYDDSHHESHWLNAERSQYGPEGRYSDDGWRAWRETRSK